MCTGTGNSQEKITGIEEQPINSSDIITSLENNRDFQAILYAVNGGDYSSLTSDELKLKIQRIREKYTKLDPTKLNEELCENFLKPKINEILAQILLQGRISEENISIFCELIIKIGTFNGILTLNNLDNITNVHYVIESIKSHLVGNTFYLKTPTLISDYLFTNEDSSDEKKRKLDIIIRNGILKRLIRKLREILGITLSNTQQEHEEREIKKGEQTIIEIIELLMNSR